MAKVFESLVCPLIQRHFQQYASDHQHGFVKSKSTCTNLVTFVEGIAEALDKHDEVDVIYTDFSKAFDKIPHLPLIEKLAAYGFTGNFSNWIRSYLTDRFFFVVVKGYESELFNVTSGIPQGSHLGPILFNIYINDLPNNFVSSTPYLFADDLKIARTIKTEADVLMMQYDLDRLCNWCQVNGMELNVDKCFFLKFTRKNRSIASEYFIDGKALQEVDKIKDLGIIVDRKLTFLPHIDDIVKRSSRMLGFIIRNSKIFKRSQTRITLYNALVRSLLEYCPVVWRPHYATHTLRIERVQKLFLWHLSYFEKIGKKKLSYNEKLKHFKMSSLSKRRVLLDLIFMYKIFNNLIDCPQLLELFKFRIPYKIPRHPISTFQPPFRTTVFGKGSPIPRMCNAFNTWLTNEPRDIFSLGLSQFRALLIEKIPN